MGRFFGQSETRPRDTFHTSGQHRSEQTLQNLCDGENEEEADMTATDSKLLFTIEIYEDAIRSEGGVASNAILAGLAHWAMELIFESSKTEKDREHARRVMAEIDRSPYVN